MIRNGVSLFLHNHTRQSNWRIGIGASETALSWALNIAAFWAVIIEGPNSFAAKGVVSGMATCPANGVDVFAQFNGKRAVYQDNVG